MGFVRRKRNVSSRMFVAAVGDERLKGYVESKFEEFCNKLGGRVEENWEMTCKVNTDAVDEIAEHVDDFHGFITTHRSMLGRPVSLVFSNPLLGGWEEYVSLTFDPEKNAYNVHAEIYGSGVEPQGVQVEDREITDEEDIRSIEMDGYWLKLEKPIRVSGVGFVDQNSATDDFVGVGSASAAIPFDSVEYRNGRVIRKVLDKVFDMASNLANAAEEELIILAEEEEEY